MHGRDSQIAVLREAGGRVDEELVDDPSSGEASQDERRLKPNPQHDILAGHYNQLTSVQLLAGPNVGMLTLKSQGGLEKDCTVFPGAILT